MMRCTVVWLEEAQNDLAEIWLDGPDRPEINAATAAIDRELAVDASDKGVEVSEGIRAFFSPPLRVLFLVRDQDRTVEVLRVKLQKSAIPIGRNVPVIHEKERQKMQRQMGQDPNLDTAG